MLIYSRILYLRTHLLGGGVGCNLRIPLFFLGICRQVQRGKSLSHQQHIFPAKVKQGDALPSEFSFQTERCSEAEAERAVSCKPLWG